MLKSLSLLSILLLSSAHAVTIEYGSVSPFAKNEVEKVLGILPANYLDSATGKISIVVEKIKDSEMTDDLCKMGPKAIFATTKKKGKNHILTISQRLLKLAQSNTTEFKCSHKTFQRLLTAVIAHELTHVKDNFEHISTEDDFQRIVGVKHLTGSRKKSLINQNTSASPDAYEFKNLEEALAVNVEFLLMDPEFECRRPATANYLSRRMGIALKNNCERNYKVLTQSAYLEDNYLQSVSIDPSRIYQIHYLFAGKGQALMSNWGHAMFRLIVCAPSRKKVGPECLDDVSHHLALSYRAYMSDLNISYIKGMFGKYPSQLFVFRFHEVQQEYTKFELRDLFSVPLKLTSDQKKEFLDVTLERFWSYQGKYYFIDNNCGTEAKKQLAIALTDDQSDLIKSITPKKMYKDIINKKNHLTEDQIDGLSKEDMIEKGFLIPSIFADLEKRFNELKSVGIFTEENLKEFLKKTRPELRLNNYEVFFGQKMLLDYRKGLVMKLIYLERYLATKFMLALPQKAFAKINKDKEVKEELMKMSGSMKSMFLQPWEVVDGQYGVPSTHEMDELYPAFVTQRKYALDGSLEAQMDNLNNLLKKETFTQELRDLESLKKIKTYTNTLFSELSGLKYP